MKTVWVVSLFILGVLFYFSGWANRIILLAIVLIGRDWIMRNAEEETLPEKFRRGITSDRFEPEKIPSNVDAIVIGSGMSGLVCAATLARVGKKVLVLEQHTIAGGGTHMYELGQYKFDSGLHYVVPYCTQLMHLVCGGVKAPLVFEKMGDEDGTFDKVVLGDDEPFHIKHKEGHIPDIYKKFPEEKQNIDKFIAITDTVLKLFPLWVLSKLFPFSIQKWIGEKFLGAFYRYTGRTAKEVMDEITSNKKLQSLLCSLWIDTGSPPQRATFMLNAAVFRGLPIEGGAYPNMGSDHMAKVLTHVIERAGGKVLVRANVTEILVSEDNKKVLGVLLDDHNEIHCSTVISSCGYHNTFGKLVEERVTDHWKIPRNLSPKVGNSLGFVMCNIGIKGQPKDLGISCSNLWYQPVNPANKFDIFQATEEFFSDPLAHEPPVMITFPSLKDRKWESDPKHRDLICCQILVMAEYSWFEKWRNEESGKRADDYQQLKKIWEEKCVGLLTRFFPKVKGHIELVDVSTPLSIEYYLKEPEGGAVGLDQVPTRFTDWEIVRHLDMKTPVQGLWMTGQDTLLCGQPIVMMSGLLTGLRVAGLVQGLKFGLYGVKTLLQAIYLS